MLSHYSSLKVAECFRMPRDALPGRIDLGIGARRGATSSRPARSTPAASGSTFPEHIATRRYLGDCLPANHPFARVRAMPAGPTAPEVWLLGSSDPSALYAAHFGLGFSFAHFMNADGGAEVTRAYRERFRPSAAFPEPRASVGVFALCADSEAEARRLAQSRDLFIVRLYTGRMGPYPSVEEAEAYPYNPHEQAIVRSVRGRSVVGTPEQVRERLSALAAEYAADELVVVGITHDPKARLRSYELLAGAFELEPREEAPS